MPKRFEAYGWHTLTVEDGNDLEAIEAAIRAGIAEEERPTLISLKTVIGYGSPRAGTRNAHSDPMPDEQVRETKEALGWDPDAQFLVPDEVVRRTGATSRERGAAAQAEWQARFDAWAAANPELAARVARRVGGQAAGRASPTRCRSSTPTTRPISTRVAASKVMQAFGPFVPTMVGGAADLVHSTFTHFEGDATFTPEHAGRNVAWGVREHGMGAAVNGLALHGGIVKPFCSTFFVFTDYMRPPIRLSALMKLDAVWIFSHDSVAVGEDGPTHQPVEHLAAMRAIPNLTVIRPADANEAAEAWARDPRGPPRPGLPRALAAERADRSTGACSRRRRGCAAARTCSPTPTRPTSCSSPPAPRSAPRSARATCSPRRASQARVVSMPSWELFEAQDADYRDEVLPARRAEDLGRGRRDVRLVALGRRLDRDRHASAPRARATRCSRTSGSARRPSPSASSRRSPSSPSRSAGPRRLHAGRAGRRRRSAS